MPRPGSTVAILAFLLVATLILPATPAGAVPAATLGSTYTDSGQDTDGDGLFDFLTIDVTLDVTSAGPFDLLAYVTQPDRFGISEEIRIDLGVGTHVVPLRLYGRRPSTTTFRRIPAKSAAASSRHWGPSLCTNHTWA